MRVLFERQETDQGPKQPLRQSTEITRILRLAFSALTLRNYSICMNSTVLRVT